MPLAAYSQWDAEQRQLQLDAAWGDPQGQHGVVRVSDQAALATLAQAEALGQRVADALRAAGAQPSVALA
jgi:hydroxymethylbilane synthase